MARKGRIAFRAQGFSRRGASRLWRWFRRVFACAFRVHGGHELHALPVTLCDIGAHGGRAVPAADRAVLAGFRWPIFFRGRLVQKGRRRWRLSVAGPQHPGRHLIPAINARGDALYLAHAVLTAAARTCRIQWTVPDGGRLLIVSGRRAAIHIARSSSAPNHSRHSLRETPAGWLPA